MAFALTWTLDVAGSSFFIPNAGGDGPAIKAA